MLEMPGNIWDYHARGYWIVIPTNGNTKGDGLAVMGRGLALQAARWYPDLPNALGLRLRTFGNAVFTFSDWKLFSFPTKVNWWEQSDLRLIACSCRGLLDRVRLLEDRTPAESPLVIALPRVGCGAGGLSWLEVKPILQSHLDDYQFVVVHNGRNN